MITLVQPRAGASLRISYSLFLGAVGSNDLLQRHVEVSKIIHQVQDKKTNPQRGEAAVPLKSRNKVQTGGNPDRCRSRSRVC